MIYILDIVNNKLVEVEIRPLTKADTPLKKDGWNFNWRQLTNNENTKSYVLKMLTRIIHPHNIIVKIYA